MSNLHISYSGESRGIGKFIGKSRDFEIIVGEPPSAGGKGDAPAPLEYSLASLAGCLNFVAHYIANELEIELKSLKIAVDGNLDTKNLLNGDCSERAGFTDIKVKFDVESDADPELLDRWLSTVKKRCPVSDNIINTTKVELTL